MGAYLRRKRWEFRSQAVAVVNALGESMGGVKKEGNTGNYVSGYREITPEAMMQRIGP